MDVEPGQSVIGEEFHRLYKVAVKAEHLRADLAVQKSPCGEDK